MNADEPLTADELQMTAFALLRLRQRGRVLRRSSAFIGGFKGF